MSFSDYIVYVDESGDHGLENIDAEYPLFVLAFCIFRKNEYIARVVPALQEFKFRYWGHDSVILHEHDIRKSRSGPYEILNRAATRIAFMDELNGLVEAMPFTIIATVLQKERLRARYNAPEHPYHLSLLYCLERLWDYLRGLGVDTQQQTTHLIFESRGRQEDEALELHFRRIINAQVPTYMMRPVLHNAAFNLQFAAKSTNSIGLQLADLVARPVGLKTLRPQQANRAFQMIEPKLYVKNGTYYGHGLKEFP